MAHSTDQLTLRSRTQRFSRILSAAIILSYTPVSVASGSYKVPDPGTPPTSEDAQILQKVSRAVNSIAQNAKRAIVFVSVFKTEKGMPPGMVDPFEFFFGPQFGQRGRGGNQPPQQQRQPRQEGLGSGFFIDMDKGYILTNNHVVEGADDIRLKLANGEEYAGKVVGRDPKTDVAVVQIKQKDFNRRGLQALALGDSSKVQTGDMVVAIGAPFGLEASVSFGVISATGRGTQGITQFENFIQTDAAINPGNSGGPLINAQGQAIGINTAIYSKSGGYNGIGFTIPSNMARLVSQELINNGKFDRGFMGVSLQALDPELKRSFKISGDAEGALIREIVPGGPAEKAGLEPGDVVTDINGQKISSPTELTSIVGLMRPGEKVDVVYMRQGNKKNAAVKIASFPDQRNLSSRDDDEGEEDEVDNGDTGGGNAPPRPGKSTKGTATVFGLSVTKPTPLLIQKYRLQSKSGLIVTEVKQDSPADRVGIRPGDLIVSIDGRKVNSLDDIKAQVGSSSRALVRIEREGQFFFMPLSD